MFDSSKKRFNAEQTTANATGFGSVAFGKSGFNLRQNRIFGDKNLAKNDFTKPIVAIVFGLVLITYMKTRRR